ncbi:MAG TPA: peptide chain release factor N(5)-glutamine methyltransferase [Tepidisphaeraceae bacterium]|nr:peptide chain release factor N(5)-glutamine methyltransferase [Tepidisphaeraceae bacterium]
MSEPAQIWTIKRLLEWTIGFFTRKNVDPARLSAELLLANVLNVSRIKLYTDYERVLQPKDLEAFRELVRRASEQEPIAYLTGKAHFFNLEFHVTRDVLIPRPDTETLVENVLQLVRRTTGFETPRILDLCTGSGCIAAAVAHHLPRSIVVATDQSPAGLEVAKQNIERLNLSSRITLLQGDLFGALANQIDKDPFDLILSNPPYIATDKMASLDKSVHDYEPHAALEGGPDGLSFHRRILADAPARLREGGRIFLEIAFDQGESARALAGNYSTFQDVQILKDHAGNDRVLAAMRK